MKITRRHLQKLHITGWQSWSTGFIRRNIGRIPNFLHPPRVINIQTAIKSLVGTPIPKRKKPIKGWCSFYAFGTNINETIILNQIEALKQHNLHAFEYILIDEGWNNTWGDWLDYDKRKFPTGLKEFAKKIKHMGFRPGIWIAPFLVSPNAKLVKSHPDWFVQKNGQFVNGYNLSSLDRHLPINKYVLDINNTHVLSYLDRVFTWLINDCGFELIKLDFLYAHHFSHLRTNDQANRDLRHFLMRLKQEYPKTYILGCGCPLLPAIGAVDGMRIGPDVSIPSFQKIPFINKLTNILLYKRVIANLQARRWTHIFWNTDPDVFLCHPTYGLSHSQLISLQKYIIKLRGNIFIGNDMSSLSQERILTYIKPLLSTRY